MQQACAHLHAAGVDAEIAGNALELGLWRYFVFELWQAAAFAAFRFFDIVKPPPARFFDERVKNGFGVMADDFVAGLYTVLTLAVLRHVLTWFGA